MFEVKIKGFVIGGGVLDPIDDRVAAFIQSVRPNMLSLIPCGGWVDLDVNGEYVGVRSVDNGYQFTLNPLDDDNEGAEFLNIDHTMTWVHSVDFDVLDNLIAKGNWQVNK